MQKPPMMSQADFEKHRKESLAEGDRRREVEKSPTDTMLSVLARLDALEAKKAPVEKPAAKKKARR